VVYVSGNLLFVRRISIISVAGSQVSPSPLRGKSDSSVLISNKNKKQQTPLKLVPTIADLRVSRRGGPPTAVI
jgi:hypothetical protein